MMIDMAMTTAQMPWALAIGGAIAALLCIVIVLTPWQISAAAPAPDPAAGVGDLLMSRYMIAFEGAAFLILAGMAGAVVLGRREARDTPQQHASSPAGSHSPLAGEASQADPSTHHRGHSGARS